MCWKVPNLTASLAYMALLPFEFLYFRDGFVPRFFGRKTKTLKRYSSVQSAWHSYWGVPTAENLSCYNR